VPPVGLIGHGAFYGFGVALVLAAPPALGAGLPLRPVRNQWVHTGPFFAVPTRAFWLPSSVLVFSWQPLMLISWATVGVAATVGKRAVRKDVPDPNSAVAPA
jgi:hypothetical protein